MPRTASSFMLFLLLTASLTAADRPRPDLSWVAGTPEVLTYRTNSPNGEGLYQVSVYRIDSVVNVYVNIIAAGFTKTVTGAMTSAMRPLRSAGTILVDGQVVMETVCTYSGSTPDIATTVRPYNRVMKARPTAGENVVDFSQTPVLLRALPLAAGARFEFPSLDPQTNAIVPLTVKVTGEANVRGIECYTVEMNDFEGASVQWVEKRGARRVVRIEQTVAKRVSELILP